MRRSSFECDGGSACGRETAHNASRLLFALPTSLKLNICLLLMEIRTPMPPRPELARPLLRNVVTNPTCSVTPVLRSISLELRYQLSHDLLYLLSPGKCVSQLVFCGVNLVFSLF